MNHKFFVWAITTSIYVLGASSLYAEEHSEDALVPDFTSSAPARVVEEPKQCVPSDDVQQKAAHDKAELLAAKLFVSTVFLANKYEAVHSSPAMQDVPVADGRMTPFLRNLLIAHESYAESSNVFTGNSVFGYGARGIPPALLWVSGGASIEGKPWDITDANRRAASSAKGTAYVLSAIIYSGGFSSAAALKRSTADITIGEAKGLKDTLEAATTEPAKLLGDLLDWSQADRTKFSRALSKKVRDSLTKSVQVNLNSPEGLKVVSNSPTVDFLRIIEDEGLATTQEMTSLRDIRNLYERAGRIREEMTPLELKQSLSKGDGFEANVAQIEKIHHLLQQVDKGLPEGEAKNEVRRLMEVSENATKTLKKLCDIGLE